jgi:hypothetical protein
MNTTYFKNIIMGNVFRTSTGTALPTTYYIGLSSTAPNADGGNVTEPSGSGSGYRRVQLTSLTTPTDGVINNSAAISFPESTSDWFPASAPAQYYVVYDAQTGGNLLMYNQLTTSRIIETNTIATIKANSLYLQLTD